MTEALEPKGKITLGLIVSWSLGLLFGLAAVLGIFDPASASLTPIFLIIALLLLPPVRAFAYKKTGKSLSTGLRVVTVIALMIIGGAMLSPPTDPTIASVTTDGAQTTASASHVADKVVTPKGLDVEKFELRMDEYGYGKIVGSLVNNTGKQHSYVQVEFNLYDGTGAQVGSTIANVNNLEVGGRWNFEAPVLEGRATEAKLKGITKF